MSGLKFDMMLAWFGIVILKPIGHTVAGVECSECNTTKRSAWYAYIGIYKIPTKMF